MTTATTAQIRYATKLRADMALYSTFPINEAELIFARDTAWYELGYSTDQDAINTRAQEICETKRARQAELGSADVESMTKAEISKYIDTVKSL